MKSVTRLQVENVSHCHALWEVTYSLAFCYEVTLLSDFYYIGAVDRRVLFRIVKLKDSLSSEAVKTCKDLSDDKCDLIGDVLGSRVED